MESICKHRAAIKAAIKKQVKESSSSSVSVLIGCARSSVEAWVYTKSMPSPGLAIALSKVFDNIRAEYVSYQKALLKASIENLGSETVAKKLKLSESYVCNLSRGTGLASAATWSRMLHHCRPILEEAQFGVVPKASQSSAPNITAAPVEMAPVQPTPREEVGYAPTKDLSFPQNDILAYLQAMKTLDLSIEESLQRREGCLPSDQRQVVYTCLFLLKSLGIDRDEAINSMLRKK